ncbi:hypothetical protein Pint_15284 [Pistacia integerrima]|uniref:Uncharacterized protein n=1 Tax=Pistacia integerrima TaxID=434235 RepID=A0ACC0Z9T0_9ROSI|nr:hypothetical protein Pint_15284 [Pistacia integerrima]
MAIRKNKKGDFITDSISGGGRNNKEVEFEGYKIPKNWKVILWVRYLHTNPENFEDPICFNPDRWNLILILLIATDFPENLKLLPPWNYLFTKVDRERVARDTHGYVGADLAALSEPPLLYPGEKRGFLLVVAIQ